jgi:hypothetical protein
VLFEKNWKYVPDKFQGRRRSAPTGVANAFTTPAGSRVNTIIKGIWPWGMILSLDTSLP